MSVILNPGFRTVQRKLRDLSNNHTWNNIKTCVSKCRLLAAWVIISLNSSLLPHLHITQHHEKRKPPPFMHAPVSGKLSGSCGAPLRPCPLQLTNSQLQLHAHQLHSDPKSPKHIHLQHVCIHLVLWYHERFYHWARCRAVRKQHDRAGKSAFQRRIRFINQQKVFQEAK